MAKVANTRKNFQFLLEIDGVNQFEIQKAKMPDVEVESVEHGDTNYNIKTPGKVKTGDMVLTKVRPAPGSDTWAMDWLKLGANAVTGGGELPINLKKMVVLREMDSTGTIALNSWICTGVWCKKVESSEFDREGTSENVMETVTLSVDICDRI